MTGRQTRLDFVIDAALAIGMIGAAWLAVFGHRGIAPCAGVMALSVAFRGKVWSDGFGLLFSVLRNPAPLSIAFAAIIAFAAWVALTAFWSEIPGAEWLGLTILVAVLGAGALVHEAANAPPRRARKMASCFVVMTVVACAMLLFEGMSGAYLRGILPPQDLTPSRSKDLIALGRGVTAMAPLVFPATILLRRMSGSWIVAATPAVTLFAASAEYSISSNVIGLACGALAFAAAMRRPQLVLKIMAVMVIASLLLAPFAAAQIPVSAVIDGDAGFLPASWAQRLVIWRHAADLALDQCMPLGCGADYARSLSRDGATVVIPNWPYPLQLMPIHPHNLFLQVWLELGAPGALTLAIALICSVRALRPLTIEPTTIAAICAAAAVSFVSLMFEASLWQAWRLSVLMLAAFGCAVAYSAENNWRKKNAAESPTRV